MKSERLNTFERTVYSLCEEIDSLKEEAAYWQKKYEDERAENMKQLNDNLERSKRSLGQALSFALRCTDDKDGNLVISKQDRLEIVDELKNNP